MSEKHLAVILTVATAFIYFVGWTYLYYYYGFFGIDIFEVGPSVQYTLVYAFPALRYLFYPSGYLCVFLSTVVVLALVVLAIRRCIRRRKIPLQWAAAAVFTLLLAIEGYYSAKLAARDKAVEEWMAPSNPAFLEFVPTASGVSTGPTSGGYQEKLEDFNKKLLLRHLLSTPQLHYLFTRENSCKAEPCAGFLFRVSVANTRVLMILHPEEEKK
jgi:hypothetical protein